jgi:hypothetical protein
MWRHVALVSPNISEERIGSDMFLQNVGSYKSHIALHPDHNNNNNNNNILHSHRCENLKSYISSKISKFCPNLLPLIILHMVQQFCN